jgi:DNA-binding transcriptional LysR family regulator
MDRLDAMSILLAAVEGGSFSAASRKLGVPLATVSRKVSQLETHLGTRLINRTSRQLILTEPGHSYIVACKQILESISEAERAATGEFVIPKGDLTITAPVVFARLYLLPVVLEFLKAHPDIDVRLVLSDQLVNLQENHIDLAVRISELADSNLVATRIGAVRRVVCGSPSYFSERGRPKAPRDLSEHDCISSRFGGLASSNVWVFATGKTKAAVTVHSRLVGNADSAVAAAVAGFGITRLLSFHVADHVRKGALICVLKEFESPAVPVSLVYAGQGLVPLKVRAFIDFAAPRLKMRLS